MGNLTGIFSHLPGHLKMWWIWSSCECWHDYVAHTLGKLCCHWTVSYSTLPSVLWLQVLYGVHKPRWPAANLLGHTLQTCWGWTRGSVIKSNLNDSFLVSGITAVHSVLCTVGTVPTLNNLLFWVSKRIECISKDVSFKNISMVLLFHHHCLSMFLVYVSREMSLS